MSYIYSIAMIIIAFTQSTLAQSRLLENVMQNPKEAITLCNQLKSLNKKGISSSSKEALERISKERNLTKEDAEILSIYVIGVHCPEVN